MAVAPIIDVQGLTKTYRQGRGRSKKAFNAVDHIDLRVDEGQVFGLLGPNGAGKTTLIKMLAGLLQPDEGTGTVLGYDVIKEHKPIRASVSLVAPTADVGTDNNLTVRQNLAFWAVVYDLDPAYRDSRINELLGFLGLADYAEFWPMSISAGMRQRLAIARSMLAHNRLLFLDEPTVKLDAAGAQTVRDLVRQISIEYGMTVILTTHMIFEAEELCQQVAIMNQGQIVSCATVDELRKNLQQYDACRITCPTVDDDLIAQIGALDGIVACSLDDGQLSFSAEQLSDVLYDVLVMLRRSDIEIEAIETDEPTLEQVFTETVRSANHAAR